MMEEETKNEDNINDKANNKVNENNAKNEGCGMMILPTSIIND